MEAQVLKMPVKAYIAGTLTTVTKHSLTSSPTTMPASPPRIREGIPLNRKLALAISLPICFFVLLAVLATVVYCSRPSRPHRRGTISRRESVETGPGEHDPSSPLLNHRDQQPDYQTLEPASGSTVVAEPGEWLQRSSKKVEDDERIPEPADVHPAVEPTSPTLQSPNDETRPTRHDLNPLHNRRSPGFREATSLPPPSPTYLLGTPLSANEVESIDPHQLEEGPSPPGSPVQYRSSSEQTRRSRSSSSSSSSEEGDGEDDHMRFSGIEIRNPWGDREGEGRREVEDGGVSPSTRSAVGSLRGERGSVAEGNVEREDVGDIYKRDGDDDGVADEIRGEREEVHKEIPRSADEEVRD